LVVGIGNPDRGDDGFGTVVAWKLRERASWSVEVFERTGDPRANRGLEGHPYRCRDRCSVGDQRTRPGPPSRSDEQPAPDRFHARFQPCVRGTATIERARSLGRLPRCLVAYLVEGEQFELGMPLSPAVADAVEEVTERVAAEISIVFKP
jgi:hydrogenase maturation protease